ncbi:MAG: ABC transporter ATP-binding protein [Deltaproteobacteria bacterium]|nr:ABC transporter ATP-binding protein [Deltaproteobacteria bacterium]
MRALSVDYLSRKGAVRAVDRISLSVGPSEIVGIAGESGCGKSTFAQAALRILPPPAVITHGQVIFEGQDLLTKDDEALRRLRWKRVSMVFQSALESLHPTLTIGAQLRDVLDEHTQLSRAEKDARLVEVLRLVDLDPGLRHQHAHQLSGGMRQRVGIAQALLLQPSLLVLDEPTTALDVMVEHAILQKLLELQRARAFSVLFITHDLSRMLQVSDRVAIFYAGELIELAPAPALRTAPKHPYTQALLRAFPSLHGDPTKLAAIPGAPPSLRTPPPGCRFAPRCPIAIDRCETERPALVQLGAGHSAACHLAK